MSKINEVAPPGWGHTKAEKEKTKPWKPKSKIGGTAAAFKRALDDGRFKGLPGDKTKKEKTASMFKLMWSMKKKGDKPHYKPGTDKKYKKYQEDWKPEGIDEAERNWYRGYDSGDKTVPRRKALNRADEFDNRGQNERADKIRSIAAKKDQGRHYEAKKDAKKIKISDKIGKLRPASIDDKRGAVSGDVQKKLSSSYELEGETIEEKYKSYKQDVLNRDKAAKRGLKTGKAGSAKARRRRRSKPGGTEKLSDVNKPAERKSMQSVGGFRGAHGASRKSKSAQGRAARIEYRRKSPAAAPKKHDTESVKKIGTFVGLQKRIKESASIRKIRGKRNASLVATGDHRRDKEGNIEADFYKKKAAPTGDKWKKTGYKKPKRDLVAMRARKKAKREKREARAREIAALPLSKSARATTVKEDFKRFMADAQAARERVKKKQEERKKKDAQFTDTKKHGIKFYDKKGSGRIVKGKKVYN